MLPLTFFLIRVKQSLHGVKLAMRAKAFEAVKPEEYEANPVWQMAFDESEQAGWNETWRKPIVGLNNLSDNSVGYFIGLRIQTTPYIANALLYDKSVFPLSGDGIKNVDWIGEIMIWIDNKWLTPSQIANDVLSYPVKLESIPDIRGESEVIFEMKEKVSICASRVN